MFSLRFEYFASAKFKADALSGNWKHKLNNYYFWIGNYNKLFNFCPPP